MIQEKLPFMGSGEEWTKRGGPGKRREGRRLKGMQVLLFCSFHVVHGMGGGQVIEENPKQNKAGLLSHFPILDSGKRLPIAEHEQELSCPA